MKTNCAVIWRSTHNQQMKRARKVLILTNLLFFIITLFLYLGWFGHNHARDTSTALAQELRDHKERSEILNVLRPRGITLSQGLDIADSLLLHSRKNGVPLALGMGIMKKESQFKVDAISDFGATNERARGLMQLLPSTFRDYNKKLKLGFSEAAIYDPAVNIRISMLHLKDLIAENKPLSKSENDLWERVLNAYSDGARGYPAAVRRYQREFEVKLNS